MSQGVPTRQTCLRRAGERQVGGARVLELGRRVEVLRRKRERVEATGLCDLELDPGSGGHVRRVGNQARGHVDELRRRDGVGLSWVRILIGRPLVERRRERDSRHADRRWRPERQGDVDRRRRAAAARGRRRIVRSTAEYEHDPCARRRELHEGEARSELGVDGADLERRVVDRVGTLVRDGRLERDEARVRRGRDRGARRVVAHNDADPRTGLLAPRRPRPRDSGCLRPTRRPRALPPIPNPTGAARQTPSSRSMVAHLRSTFNRQSGPE